MSFLLGLRSCFIMDSTLTKNKPSLDNVPVELVERIAKDLDLASIRSLRLTTKSLGDLCCGPCFKRYLSHQRIDLTPDSIQTLCQIATHPMLGSAVQHLTILAVIYDKSELDSMLSTKRGRFISRNPMGGSAYEPCPTDEQLNEFQHSREKLVERMRGQQQLKSDESEVQLLTDALRKFGTLAVLAVKAAVDQGYDEYVSTSLVREWQPVWVRAAKVYQTTMLAIARSNVAVDSLQVFKVTQRCSIPTWDVNAPLPAFEAANFARAAKYIKAFSISISTKVKNDAHEIDSPDACFSEDDRETVADGNYPGVARLLAQMPNLKSLDLHQYVTLRDRPNSHVKVFTPIADDVKFPSLRHCALRGIRCNESSLLTFLRRHNDLLTLELHEIHLHSGSWAAVFAHMAGMPQLQRVELSNLWKPGDGTVHLAPLSRKWKSEWGPSGNETDQRDCSFPCAGANGGLHVYARNFTAEEIRNERFEFAEGPRGRAMGSPRIMWWSETRRAEYGPP